MSSRRVGATVLEIQADCIGNSTPTLLADSTRKITQLGSVKKLANSKKRKKEKKKKEKRKKEKDDSKNGCFF